jgi:hypothetical protein
MKNHVGQYCSGFTLAAVLLLGGCTSPHTARAPRVAPSYAFTVVKSSLARQLTADEMVQLQVAVERFLAGQGMVNHGDYFVRLDFAPVAPGAAGEWVIVRLSNLPGASSGMLAADVEEDPAYEADRPVFEPVFYGAYEFYAPWDYSYVGYQGPILPLPRRPRDYRPGDHKPGDHKPGEHRTAGGVDFRPNPARVGADGKPIHDHRPLTAEYSPRQTDPNRRREADAAGSPTHLSTPGRWNGSAGSGLHLAPLPARSSGERGLSSAPAPARALPAAVRTESAPARADPTPASSSRSSDRDAAAGRQPQVR